MEPSTNPFSRDSAGFPILQSEQYAEEVLESLFTPTPEATPLEQAEQTLRQPKRLIYCALSTKNFCWRAHIVKFVLDEGHIPICPFMLFDYYLLHTVPKQVIREATNNLIARSDQIWIFGPNSRGIRIQIGIAKRLRKPLSFFDITDLPERVVQIPEALVEEEFS